MINICDDKPAAPCVNDPDLFFPGQSEYHKLDKAQKLCMGCPKRAACLDYAHRTKQAFGIWGGVNFGTPVLPSPQPIKYGPDGWPVEIVDRSRYTATHCKSGRHRFTARNTLWTRQHGALSRSCRTCRNAYRATQRRTRKPVLAA